MIDSNSPAVPAVTNFSMWVAAPGLIALAFCVLFSIGFGFYAAFHLRGDATLIASMSIFIFPAPYLAYSLVGFAMVCARQSRALAKTFNLGGVVLFVAWWVGNFYISAPGETVAQHLNTSLLNTAIASGGLAVVLVGLLAVVNKLVAHD